MHEVRRVRDVRQGVHRRREDGGIGEVLEAGGVLGEGTGEAVAGVGPQVSDNVACHTVEPHTAQHGVTLKTRHSVRTQW